MAHQRARDQITIPLSHLPTWFFIVGYPLFWIELAAHSAPDGVTSIVPWLLLIILAVWSSQGAKQSGKFFLKPEGILWPIASLGVLLIGTIVIVASLKPIHLLQEFDCLQYHYTLPRQHLILGSFAHIPWAADDLFLLPMDFALAPFWFATSLPNKIPQLFILFGLCAVAVRLTVALAGARRPWAGPLVVLAILGTHGLGIQFGTAMLDLGIAYLFLASLDSLRQGQWLLAGVEFAFFFWSKPLMPLEVISLLVIGGTVLVLGRQAGWKSVDTFNVSAWPKAFRVFLIASLVVGGPFILKSMEYAATPFFPVAPGLMGTGSLIQSHPKAWESLQHASQTWMIASKDSYGHGRGMVAFIRHWWLVAVPEKGVNNAFDYPLGLTYLLLIGPFFINLIRDTQRRLFSPLSVFAVMIWGLWWFGPQQTRFLYIPVILIFIVTIARLERVSRVLLACIAVSLMLEAVSLWGAHKADLKRWGRDDLRTADQQLVMLSNRYISHALTSYVDWPTHDVAYAQFPVMVHQESLPHTVQY